MIQDNYSVVFTVYIGISVSEKTLRPFRLSPPCTVYIGHNNPPHRPKAKKVNFYNMFYILIEHFLNWAWKVDFQDLEVAEYVGDDFDDDFM